MIQPVHWHFIFLILKEHAVQTKFQIILQELPETGIQAAAASSFADDQQEYLKVSGNLPVTESQLVRS